jgi:predicted transcriptional regulator of viral defense system
MVTSHSKSIQQAISAFRRHGGMLRTGAAIREGIHPRILYEMRDQGLLEPISRGLYRLSTAPSLGSPDLVAVALRVPNAVVCLISALAYHELTTQIPHEVYLALPRGTEPPRLKQPPLRTFWFTGRAFTDGIETHKVDGITVRIYGPEKTLADCFKYRNKIGLDTTLEALRLYKDRRRSNVEALLRYSEVCRVTKVMRPYLEAIL